MHYNYEEFECLEINEKEKEAIKNYIGSNHIGINSLLDLDLDLILKLKNKGWRIDLSKEEIEKNIERLEKIYAAMYKYGKKNSNKKRKLYRGTSINEIYKLKESQTKNSFISTSLDESIAMDFTEYENGAMISVNIDDDIPYLNMDEFLDEDIRSEEEILLAPFCKIDRIIEENTRDDNSIKDYSLDISKTEFESLSDDEKRECEDIIYNFDFNKEMAKYAELSERYESLYTRIFETAPNPNDAELKLHLNEEFDEVSQKMYELKKRFDNVKVTMCKYLQGKFKQKELELEKDIQQEEVLKTEEIRKNKIEDFKIRREKLIEKLNEVAENLEETKDTYLNKDEDEIKLNELASDMKISIDEDNEKENVISKFESLKSNLEAIKKEIEDIEISDDLTFEELDIEGELNLKINEKYEQLLDIDSIMEECKNEIDISKSENKESLQRKIAKKIREAITDKVVSDLEEQRATLESKKDTVFEKLFGKSKLKQAQIENLDLKVKAARESNLNIPEDFEGVKKYLKKYNLVVGDNGLPDEVQKLLGDIKKDDMPEITKEDRDSFELYFNSGVPINAEKKLSKKDLLTRLTLQNKRLTEQIDNSKKEEIETESFFEGLNEQKTSKLEQNLDIALSLSSSEEVTLNNEISKEEYKKEEEIM